MSDSGLYDMTDHPLMNCLYEWGIDKVFTITVDNAKRNDKALRVLKDYF